MGERAGKGGVWRRFFLKNGLGRGWVWGGCFLKMVWGGSGGGFSGKMVWGQLFFEKKTPTNLYLGIFSGNIFLEILQEFQEIFFKKNS